MTVFVTGAYGLVGSRFVELNADRFSVVGSDRGEAPFDLPVAGFVPADITNPASVAAAIGAVSPDAVVHFAAWTDVDGAERQKGNKNAPAWVVNVQGTEHVVAAAKKCGAYTLMISTGHVFDGRHAPSDEQTQPNPVNWYGVTKREAELVAERIDPDVCITRLHYPFRASFPFKTDLVRGIMEKLRKGTLPPMFTDQKITPTFIDDIASGLAILLEKRITGVVHLVGSSSHTPFEISTMCAKTFFKERKRTVARTTLKKFRALYPDYAPRPMDDRLTSLRLNRFGIKMHPFKAALFLLKSRGL